MRRICILVGVLLGLLVMLGCELPEEDVERVGETARARAASVGTNEEAELGKSNCWFRGRVLDEVTDSGGFSYPLVSFERLEEDLSPGDQWRYEDACAFDTGAGGLQPYSTRSGFSVMDTVTSSGYYFEVRPHKVSRSSNLPTVLVRVWSLRRCVAQCPEDSWGAEPTWETLE